MVLNSLFPVFALLGLGILLKHTGLTSDAFLRTSDRLVYFIFFPILLFWKIGQGAPDTTVDMHYTTAVFCALLTTYLCSTLFIVVSRMPRFAAGSFSQSCYRFNTYIGMAIVMNAFGEAGVRYFGILIGVTIPVINLLAVSTLIWYSGTRFTAGQRFRLTVKALVSNPLILACLAGLLYARLCNGFPRFIDNTLRLSASVTLPLALLSIGSALTLKTIRRYWKLSAAAALFKLFLLPVTGYLCLTRFGVNGLPFQVAMVFFSLPTSTAIYVLSSQLNSDTELASAAIVLSTIASFVSLSIVLMI